MRKLMTLMMAAMLVFGFSTMAVAGTLDPSTLKGNCGTCETDLANIDVCGGQDANVYFDYEDFGSCGNNSYVDDLQEYRSYCSGIKGGFHKAFFQICDCLDLWNKNLELGDTLDISMEIVVKKSDGLIYTGDNGVYWADDAASIGADFARDSEVFCDNTKKCEPDQYEFDDLYAEYLNSTYEDADKSWKLIPDYTSPGHGIEVDEAFLDNLGFGEESIVAWLNIPEMFVDPAKIESGAEVWVKVCMYYVEEGQSRPPVACTACCCLIPIGELCCDPTQSVFNKALYPYGTKLDQSQGWWFGMVITNISDTDGTAKITYYENDGDMATAEIAVAANKMVVLTDAELIAALVPSVAGATIGDATFYVIIEGVGIPLSGFAMMGNGIGASMGYVTVPVPGQ